MVRSMNIKVGVINLKEIIMPGCTSVIQYDADSLVYFEIFEPCILQCGKTLKQGIITSEFSESGFRDTSDIQTS